MSDSQVQGTCDSSHVVWLPEQNPGPVQALQVRLDTEPSLQPKDVAQTDLKL